MLSRIRVILVETSHPGNIGAVARAMKNMGLHRLYLVAPLKFPDADADARASGADDVLANARVVADLPSALEGCHMVLGASARIRKLSWPQFAPREAAIRLLEVAQQGDVALVFGRERNGLSNEELDLCHYLVHIPCNPEFSSLNIAAAVQVLAYEIYSLWQSAQPSEPDMDIDQPLARAEDMQLFYEHLEKVLVDIDFLDPEQPRKLMRRLKRLYNRAQPDQQELNILRGILTAVEKYGNPPG